MKKRRFSEEQIAAIPMEAMGSTDIVRFMAGALAGLLSLSALAEDPPTTSEPPIQTRWVQVEDTRNQERFGVGLVSYVAPDSVQLLPESSTFTVWTRGDAYFSDKTVIVADALWIDCDSKRLKNLRHGWLINGDYVPDAHKATSMWMPADTRFHEILRINFCPEVLRLKERPDRKIEEEARVQKPDELNKAANDEEKELSVPVYHSVAEAWSRGCENNGLLSEKSANDIGIDNWVRRSKSNAILRYGDGTISVLVCKDNLRSP